MEAALLIDFGSTYTKVAAADVARPRLLGRAASRTTADTDVGEGLADAIEELRRATGAIEYSRRLACSSAAGGLRMVACGLVPDLTAKAARLASLGAGARVEKAYSYQLTEDDAREIDAIRPDILLLTGGTDGGDEKCILRNAETLAGCAASFPIVVAGNRSCASRVMAALKGREAHLCDNVMPALGALSIESARAKIREIFLERIVRAKGLSRESGLLAGIMMPTPAAVLAAVELLAGGRGEESGIGELVAVDLGGATTDVYSVAAGTPKGVGVVYRGLPEPYAKRTVEGDLGMRHSAHGVLEAAGAARLSALSGVPEEKARAMALSLSAGAPAEGDDSAALDFALAALSVETATERHAGTMEEAYGASGLVYVQSGKDLRDVARVVMTGGALVHARRQGELAARALYSDARPQSLRPRKAEALVDKDYVLSAMGLLSSCAPAAALSIMKQSISAIDVAISGNS